MSDDDTLPSTLLDAATQVYVDNGVTLDQARDVVIARCLEGGDTGAFVYFETIGHTPGRSVLRLLSVMMTKNPPPDVAVRFPFMLACKRRNGKRGPHEQPLIEMRDELLALNVKARIDAGLSRDAAAAEVAELVSDKASMRDGRSIKFETVLSAYKRHAAALGK